MARALDTRALIMLLTAIPALYGCDSLDDDRIPAVPVNVTFQTIADWNIYGVNAAMDWQRFIRSERIPANFFYTDITQTGFGGVLLVCDVLGEPQAYDLACPVECRNDVRVSVSSEGEQLAVCPKCGSSYNVFSLAGHPVSGPAAEHGYALRKYRVVAGRTGAYRLITF